LKNLLARTKNWVKEKFFLLKKEAKDTGLKEWLIYLISGVFSFIITYQSLVFLSNRYAIGWNETLSLSGHFFLVEKDKRDLKRGDQVCFYTRDLLPYYPKKSKFVKRIVGVEGDYIAKKGRIFTICKKEKPTECITAKARKKDSKGNPAPQFIPEGEKIPSGCFFVLGDHPQSFDSRYWGYVSKEEVIGKAASIF